MTNNENIKYYQSTTFNKNELFQIATLFENKIKELEKEKEENKKSELNTTRITRRLNEAKASKEKAQNKWFYYDTFTY